MKHVTLLYHDVIEGGRDLASGFTDPAARRYKLERSAFVEHLDQVASVISQPPVTVTTLTDEPVADLPVMLSFDDGGVSGLTIVAQELARRSWRAHFFVTTDFIGRPGFLDVDQIRRLQQMGHTIGSHSCSHPNPMSACSWETLIDEWTRSVTSLSEILREPVSVASIPGGAYSKHVARAASRAGITRLFTSEPLRSTWQVDDCTMLGRYCIESGDPPCKSAALVSGQPATLAREFFVWNGKQVVKRVAGPPFYRLRCRWSRRSPA